LYFCNYGVKMAADEFYDRGYAAAIDDLASEREDLHGE
jgi:hypothetical protein